LAALVELFEGVLLVLGEARKGGARPILAEDVEDLQKGCLRSGPRRQPPRLLASAEERRPGQEALARGTEALRRAV